MGEGGWEGERREKWSRKVPRYHDSPSPSPPLFSPGYIGLEGGR